MTHAACSARRSSRCVQCGTVPYHGVHCGRQQRSNCVRGEPVPPRRGCCLRRLHVRWRRRRGAKCRCITQTDQISPTSSVRTDRLRVSAGSRRPNCKTNWFAGAAAHEKEAQRPAAGVLRKRNTSVQSGLRGWWGGCLACGGVCSFALFFIADTPHPPTPPRGAY